MDPFKSAQSKVLDLQDRHDKLERSIPKLRALEDQLNENIGALQRSEVIVVDKLEKVKAEIARRTSAFNVWMAGEQSALTVEKNKLETQIQEFHKERDVELVKKKQAQKEIADRQQALNKLTDQLTKERTEVNAQRGVNNRWSEKLVEQEKAVAQGKADNATRNTGLEAKSKALDEREAAIPDQEKRAVEALKTAEIERNSAHVLLEDAKEKIAATDAKELELDRREVLLTTKENDLNSLAIRLNDRKAVIEANAKL